MSSKLSLDIIILAPTGGGLDKTLESLIEQSPGRKESISLYICGSGAASAGSVTERLRKRFEEINISVEGAELCECLYHGMELHKDRSAQRQSHSALTVIREGTVLSDKALRSVFRALERGAKAVCLHTLTLRHTNSHLVRILHNPYEEYLPQRPAQVTVDINKYPHYVHTAPDAYTFGADAAAAVTASFRHDMSLKDDALAKFTLEMLRQAGGFEYIAGQDCMIGMPLENSPAVFAAQHQAWWYTPSVRNFWLPYLAAVAGENNIIPPFIQYAAVHNILSKIKCNFEDKNRNVLVSAESVEEFYDAAARALALIDDELTVSWSGRFRWTGLKEAHNAGFHRCMLTLLLRRKARLLGGKLELKLDGADVVLDMPRRGGQRAQTRLCRADSEALEIYIIEHENGRLVIDGTLTCADFIPPEELRARAVYRTAKNGDETIVPLGSDPVYPLIKCFGRTAAHKYNVHFELPDDAGLDCRFEYELCGQWIPMKLLFVGAYSRLVTGMSRAYWMLGGHIALRCPDGRRLTAAPLRGLKKTACEAGFARQMLGYKGARKLIVLAGLGVRALYRVTRPFYGKKRRWVTFDKLYKAGDNGDYFFRYAQTRKDGIRVYYVLDRKAAEYPEMKKKYRRVLPAFSVKTMLTVLNSEVIAATHSTVLSYLGFPKPLQPFFRDLFGFRVACIQHGLTVQELAQYQNRVFDNTTLYCLASKHEYDNVVRPIYGYDKSQLKLTGLARFDGLVNDDRKFILITPTWRRDVVNAGIAHIKKSHSDVFKGSEYYRLYNTLINDAKLIETAKRCGYGITYLLHPAMSAQIDDFDKNDYVKLEAAAGDISYERVLTQASLMVTDYSGVQFDFAYMRKPIVYYHPDTLPPQYASASIDYAADGFGEICTRHEQLVDTLCRYMENGCRNTEYYIARADSFFAYADRNNCERIYDAVEEFSRGGK